MIKTIVDAHNPEFNYKMNLELNRIVRETYEKHNHKGTTFGGYSDFKSKDLSKAFETVSPVKTLKLTRKK